MSAPISPPSSLAAPKRFAVTKYALPSPPTGEHFEFATSFRTLPADGSAPKFRFVWTLAPGKRGPGLHVHEVETETFEIVSGTLRIWIDGTPKDFAPGDFVAIPPMVKHRFLNPGKEPVVVNVTLDGPNMEDAFIPMAVAVYGRKPKLNDFLRMTMRLGDDPPPSTPQIPAERFVLKSVVALLKLFGVKRFDAVTGWDADQSVVGSR